MCTRGVVFHIGAAQISIPCCSLILAVSLCVSFVLTEYLRGDVLPAEQHAASDLPRFLHPNSHLKALMDRDAPCCILKAFGLTHLF